MSGNYQRKKLEMRYEKLMRRKEKESEREARIQEDLKLSKQLKFADHIENIQDSEARLVIKFFSTLGSSKVVDFKYIAMRIILLILHFHFYHRLRATFEQFDVDGDGSLTCEEIRKSMQGLLGEEDLEDLLAHLFGSENDEVDVDEFVNAMMARIENKESIPILDESSR